MDTPADLEVPTTVRTLQVGCWIALITAAAVRAWFTRYELSPDSMSYLDIARAIAEGHPHAAINGYWSPGYPVLVSLFLRLFAPNVYWEFPLVHVVNLLIFAGTLASFQMFWREAFKWHGRVAEDLDAEMPEDAFWAIGYAAFSIAFLNIVTVSLVGPDLLVSACVLLAGWTVLRFRRFPGISGAALLGVVLALGYYAKAPFFPMAAVFILCACWKLPVSPRRTLQAGTAAATFLLVCAPLITALSWASGRLTFGDSARLSQAFYIDGVQYFRHWQGGPPGSGAPLHPTRELNEFPRIYEFTAKDMGTYPPWYAPTYWYEGVRPHIEFRRQTALFIRNLAVEFQIVMEPGSTLVFVVILLALLAEFRKRWIHGVLQLWFMWLPGLAALTMYALVHVEPRFLGGWLILLFAGAVCAFCLPTDAGLRKAIRCIGNATLLTVGALVLLQASREAVGKDHAIGRTPEEAIIAAGLLHNGLHPGDPIALIGDGTGAYWAHLARLRIISEIPAGNGSHLSALDFWESGPDAQQKALEILQRTGARAVIAGSPQDSLAAEAPSVVPPPWKKIDGTDTYVYFFPGKP